MYHSALDALMIRMNSLTFEDDVVEQHCGAVVYACTSVIRPGRKCTHFAEISLFGYSHVSPSPLLHTQRRHCPRLYKFICEWHLAISTAHPSRRRLHPTASCRRLYVIALIRHPPRRLRFIVVRARHSAHRIRAPPRICVHAYL